MSVLSSPSHLIVQQMIGQSQSRGSCGRRSGQQQKAVVVWERGSSTLLQNSRICVCMSKFKP